jgi:flagellar export protein FliJ
MARFRTLIELWERRVEAARQQLGRTMLAIEAARGDISACEHERVAGSRDAALADPRWYDQYRAFCSFSLGREAAHRHNLAAFERMAEEQRRALAAARQQQRTFELLQEREDRRLARRERRREEAMLVDHALRRWREVHT